MTDFGYDLRSNDPDWFDVVRPTKLPSSHYSPVEHIVYGGELQWARRTNFADGFHSNDYRVQFSFKYNFSAQIGGVK